MQDSQDNEQIVAERKRRLTAPGSPGRRGAPLPYIGSSSTAVAGPSQGSVAAGTSWTTAIDLTEDNERPLPPPPFPIRRTSRPTVPTAIRRHSDIQLPQWQADADVSQCPVCKVHFTFWYRKHHCRKCGRVVCANCSPHRITIPRQFIVRPPDPPNTIIDLTGDTSPASPSAPLQLWGGEEVRVCNPCVPDPNYSPPPRAQLSPDPIPPEHWRFPSSEDMSRSYQPLRRPRNTSGPLPPLPPHATHRPTLSDAARLTSTLSRRPNDPFRAQRVSYPVPTSIRDLYTPPSFLGNAAPYPPRVSSSNAGASSSSSLPNTGASYHSPVPPRREIAEEDECPICGEELPPKGPNGETIDREGHVQDCIGSHLYTASSPVPSILPAPSPFGEGSSASSVASAPPPPGSLPRANSAPLRPRRMTGGRMLTYQATEKDCLGEDGEAAECVICFEEFEEGDEMGRLECLCRFHRACIRQWWETKGAGSCPTHQLHD